MTISCAPTVLSRFPISLYYNILSLKISHNLLLFLFAGNSALMMHAEDTGMLRTILSGVYGPGVQDNLLQSLRHVLLMEEVISLSHALQCRLDFTTRLKHCTVHEYRSIRCIMTLVASIITHIIGPIPCNIIFLMSNL
jgi:uncharacterized membrane protein YeaQ/YmgE (transglycosylase-associated protein family)